MLASIVIRTLNEAKFLGDLLQMIHRQTTLGLDYEVILVDSGSTDSTVSIATNFGCRIATITKADFSFGRSLNVGCDAARGEYLVFISGHCVPVNEHWLQRLCQPIIDERAVYSYGRQIGDDDSNFSERRIFAKYFSDTDKIPQQGFFCNNANAAISRAAWEPHRFDEDLTGLEDMALAKLLVEAGEKVAYVADAPVFHHHQESWQAVRRRFEREAIALQKIMPEVHLSLVDVTRYILMSTWMDWRSAFRHKKLWRDVWSILRYRIAQYTGSYAGNHSHRRLSQERKERFFYPSIYESETADAWLEKNRRPPTDEGQQPASKREKFPSSSR